MSNICANQILDAMCNVCGTHCAAWIGDNEQGDREYTLDCLDEDGQRYIVVHTDLMEAVYELGVLVGVEWED